MKAFELIHPQTVAEATRLLAEGGYDAARPMGGGQDLLGTMKDYILTPDRVVDLKRIPGLSRIAYDPAQGLSLGALVTITEVEEHPGIRRHFAALAEAASSIASIQIRNVGTVGGNLCQRPRCWYYRNEHIVCLKKGGSKCYAAPDSAENKYNAILGGGPSYIVHPSDLAPVLMAFSAVLTIAGPGGKARKLPIAEFFTLPGEGSVTRENVLQPGEIVTEVFVPASPLASRSTYLKFREKNSLDWALSSVAMALETDGGVVREARVVLGGVAPIPWRAKAAEDALRGQPLSESAIRAAAEASTEGAKPLSQNGYKVPLTHALVRRAAQVLAAGPRPAFGGGEGGIA
ncbi:MAG: xanthine dehydrogenase family protein subunit M [Armatimonadetes bacterium]|nr:xanthine dehydrogenase family protein subunit M [Armatimonadota bacterium]